MIEKVNPFIDTNRKHLLPEEISNIKQRLIQKETLKSIQSTYPFVSIQIISKIRTGDIYLNIAPEYNEELFATKRLYHNNDDKEFADKVYQYYKDHPELSDEDVANHFGISIYNAQCNRKLESPFNKLLPGYKPIIFPNKESKFSPKEVSEIREKLDKGISVRKLAKEYNCGRATIQDMKYHRGSYSY